MTRLMRLNKVSDTFSFPTIRAAIYLAKQPMVIPIIKCSIDHTSKDASVFKPHSCIGTPFLFGRMLYGKKRKYNRNKKGFLFQKPFLKISELSLPVFHLICDQDLCHGQVGRRIDVVISFGGHFIHGDLSEESFFVL